MVEFPCVVPFADANCDSAHAIKVLGKAADLVKSVKACDEIKAIDIDDLSLADVSDYEIRRMNVLDASMDVLQALANVLVAFPNDEITGSYLRCIERNRGHDRY